MSALVRALGNAWNHVVRVLAPAARWLAPQTWLEYWKRRGVNGLWDRIAELEEGIREHKERHDRLAANPYNYSHDEMVREMLDSSEALWSLLASPDAMTQQKG